MRKFLWSMVAVLLVTGLAFTVGCQFGGGNPLGTAGELVAPTAAPVGGNARVAFSINVTADDTPNPQASYRAETTGASVKFTLIGIRSGEQTGPTTATLTRTVPVNPDGTAEVTFENVPELSTLAQIRLEGANIRGYRDFHGGADLKAGNNLLRVNPVGSGLKQDLLARVLKDTIANPALVRAAPKNMCARVTLSLNSISLDVATNTRAVDAFNTFASQLQPTGFTQVRQLGTNDGFAMGNATYTNAELFAQMPTDYSAISADAMQVDSVFRQGFGGFGLVGFQSADDAVNSLVQIDPVNPANRFTCFAPGPIVCVTYVWDGTMVAGGYHKNSGVPFLFRWSGYEAAALPTAAPGAELPPAPAGLMWVRHFLPTPSGINGTPANPARVDAIAYNPEFDELVVTVNGPDGMRIFRVNASTGANGEGFADAAMPMFLPPPMVEIASPVRQITVAPGSRLTLVAEASPTPGAEGAPEIVRVDFFQGAFKLGDATRVGQGSSWQFVWESVPAGYHQLMARAFDGAGGSQMSKPIEVFAMPLNVQRPGVAIASPTNGAVFEMGQPVTIVAQVVASGTIRRVEFWEGATLIGEVATAPWAFRWVDAMPGFFMFTARAYTASGGFGISEPVSIQINPDRPEWDMAPMLEVVEPRYGAAFNQVPADIPIVIRALEGTPFVPAKVRRIEFLRLPADGMAVMPMDATMPAVRRNVTTGSDPETGTDTDVTTTPPWGGSDEPVNFWGGDLSALPPGAYKIGEVTGVDPANPSQYRFVWQGVPEGLHHIVARVYDDFGSVNELGWILVKVGNVNVPPYGWISYHEPWEPARGERVTVHIWASDPDGTIESMEMLLNGMPLPGAPVRGEGDEWTWQGVIPDDLPLGPVLVEAVFTDNAGKTGRAGPALIPYGGMSATGVLTGGETGWDTGWHTGWDTGIQTDTGAWTGDMTDTGTFTNVFTGDPTGTGTFTNTWTGEPGDTGTYTSVFTGDPTGTGTFTSVWTGEPGDTGTYTSVFTGDLTGTSTLTSINTGTFTGF